MAVLDRDKLVDCLLHLSQLYDRTHRPQAARAEATRALELATKLRLEHLYVEAKNQLSSIESLVPDTSQNIREFHGLLYLSGQMQGVISRLKIIAATSEVVLLLGETGTGKELAARAIHAESKRKNGPFIPFNCSALSRDLIESRLFGHRKGAFTGADRDHAGVIRAASGGTLFLDEIGDLSLEAQGALLRFLQSGEIQPVGTSKPVKTDARVIAATNRDLRNEVEAGRFRRDLFYRLDVATLLLPPLRFRRDDIALLARHFAELFSKQYNLAEPVSIRAEMPRLLEHDWPGNVRELENYVKRLILFGTSTIATNPEATQQEEAGGNGAPPSWRGMSESDKLQRLVDALRSNSGNITATARQLSISRRTVYNLRRRITVEGDSDDGLKL
ncbi:MAG TPA: sigma-54 dependent transcriptional regulator [Blastocatellia bacterium]|nr:sigma-54 dependent transcriptional regulator [Blastocatellia bacterium]